MKFHSALYRGELVHARHDRFARVFRYPVYMAAIDPAELAALDRELRLFSLGRWNAYSLDASDYATPLDTRAVTTPFASRAAATPIAKRADARPLGTRADADMRAVATPLDSRAAATPLGTRAVATPLDSRADATPLRTRADARPLDTRADARPLDTRADARPLDARADARPLDTRADATPLGAPTDATRLITNLRAFGYVFNPVSFFLRYRAGALATVTAEVNNTYGGRRCYELGDAERIENAAGRIESVAGRIDNAAGRIDSAAERIDSAAGRIERAAGRTGFRTARDFFVSPFLHGELVYDWWFEAPLDGERLSIEMFVQAADTGRRALTARFSGTRVPLSDRTLAAAAIRYPVMAAQVIGLIHWQALKLRVLGAPYHRPGPDHRPISSTS